MQGGGGGCMLDHCHVCRGMSTYLNAVLSQQADGNGGVGVCWSVVMSAGE